ncbi:MAG TPA: tRNA uridine-5-carboxymethylaminomethyl(34) synthesis GTPase MnmE [Candidatus Desulfobacillus sp.]|nr:tRNA uridine-5-carboxymethylaminomethyl(34) synthesis GTPase MnmE [Candidatus Desulfobacillus sp.]
MPSQKPAERIAAIATPPGRGGIGIVRLSGPDLQQFGRHLTERTLEPRIATRCRFLDGTGMAIDEGIALFFPAPRSYTGEDVLELQGHGGPVVMQMLLQRCQELGARLAAPGEFTLRAYLNGKLDLAQAEAVADLIEASTAAAARSATRSLSGEFSRAIHDIADRLVALRVRIEASLDFPEEDAGFLEEGGELSCRLAELAERLERMLRGAQRGSILRTGLRVVLVGQPNVGKSSLLNRLAGEERAIVSAVPGTTRDALRETIAIDGIPLQIIDTAGLREAGDEVEQLGIARSWQEIAQADVVLHLLDARQGMAEDDSMILAKLPHGIERLVVMNKCDLTGHDAGKIATDGKTTLWLSALTGAGIPLLEQELLRVAGGQADSEDVFLARNRHLAAIEAASSRVLTAASRPDRLELCAEELRLAQRALSSITGEFTSDDLLGEIFSGFCIGK